MDYVASEFFSWTSTYLLNDFNEQNMKVYYYGESSKTLVKAIYRIRNRAKWLRFPLAALLALVWVIVMPVAWLLIQIGEFGHAVAGWCGFESRDW